MHRWLVVGLVAGVGAAVAALAGLSERPLHAVAHAFCGQSPARMLGQSLGRAAKQEIEWFKRRWRRAG